MSNAVIEELKNRRSYRSYKDTMIPEEDLHEIMEA